MQREMLWLGILVFLSIRPGLLVSGEHKQGPISKDKPAWYDTLPIGVELVEQKETITVDALKALEIFDESQDQLTENWISKLPGTLTPAKLARQLPAADGVTRHVSERKPLELQIRGFDQNRVHVVVTRHVGNHLWHWYHAVEADLMVERSDKVDALLNLKTFTTPFTRTLRGVGYGDSRDQVRERLGPPDAERFTQSPALSWDYYFEENITIEYKSGVFKISNEVPKPIKDRSLDNPLVRYRASKASSEGKPPKP
jgi:hypothetical protein